MDINIILIVGFIVAIIATITKYYSHKKALKKEIAVVIENLKSTMYSVTGKTYDDEIIRLFLTYKQPNANQFGKLVKVVDHGIEVFGTQKLFIIWLNEPNIALGNIEPNMLLNSDYGLEQLDQELGRIAHGILT